jgi:hypothetical protein
MLKLNSNVNIFLLLAGSAFAIGLVIGVITESKNITIKRGESSPASLGLHDQPGDKNTSTFFGANNLSGIECLNNTRRPIAVMIAEDEEARPLSGIGMADLVIEMPVVEGSVTRMMAFFVCEEPREIGSVRSTRHDFITLAKGYDAILAHWGGSSFAQEDLASGIVDNLDALPNHFDAFYRKNWIPAPHNGFTSIRRMVYAAQNLDYRLTTQFKGYKFLDNEGVAGKKSLKVGYAHPYDIKYEYNPLTNSYYRWRGGSEEIDYLQNKQVSVKNVIIMRTTSRELEGWYNDVDVVGLGEAWVYRNGEEIKATWKKESAEDVLRFYNEDKKEIEFVRGKIWINIVDLSTIVNYE